MSGMISKHGDRDAGGFFDVRHFFVINPHSFRRKTDHHKQVLTEIEGCFTGLHKADYEIYISRYPRDAVAVIHQYIAAVSGEIVRVYAIGGDGILFDCLNGMADFPNAELTAVPYGSSNDFVRSFGENALKNFRDIKKLCAASPLLVDIIDCGANYAINEVAFGVEAQAILNVNKLLRHPRLKFLHKNVALVYKLGAFYSVMNEEVNLQQYQLLLDEEDLSGCFCNISVSNGPCIGGNMVSSPYAKPNDGLLDAIFTKGGSTLSVASCVGSYTKGHFEKSDMFFRKQFRRMEIKSETPIRVHLDGESFYTDEIKLKIIPGKIKFCTPEGMDFVDYSYRAYKGKKNE